VPSQNRSQYINYKGGKIILDAYNANPSSMEAALNNLFSIPHLNKIAILGDMFELGDEAPYEHKKIADFADNSLLSQVILIGKNFKQVAVEKKWVHFDTVTEAKNYFDSIPFSTALLLIKGSRGMKLESLVENSEGKSKVLKDNISYNTACVDQRNMDSENADYIRNMGGMGNPASHTVHNANQTIASLCSKNT
jgi:UDP-N-acetylmuramyl pentapeptide synthase